MFTEIVVYFLLVGHTGNAVDQLFSILTQEFKKCEIQTIEELFEKIVSSPINPTPECESLKFIWNWRDYISGYLTNKELKNHSFYNAFNIKKEKTAKEGKVTKLRAKRLPQDEDWVPPTGIRILQPDVPFDPVGSADFRVEELLLPKIVENLQKYFRRMPTHTRVTVGDSWNRLREMLENLPRMQENLPRLRLHDLPKIPLEQEPKLPDEFSFVEDDDELPEIIGDVFEEGLFDSNIREDIDVVIYTEVRDGRPWLGRIKQVLEDRKFTIQWFQRQGKSTKYHAMFNTDKTPYVTQLENQNVMMWEISVEKTLNSFHITPYRLTTIMKEYKKYDDM